MLDVRMDGDAGEEPMKVFLAAYWYLQQGGQYVSQAHADRFAQREIHPHSHRLRCPSRPQAGRTRKGEVPVPLRTTFPGKASFGLAGLARAAACL